MNNTFVKSVVAGIMGLTLAASCSQFGKKESNNCGAKNGCASKKKEEMNKCSANKCSANKCSGKKASKKAKKVQATEEKK